MGSPWAAGDWVCGLKREKGSLQLENVVLKNAVGSVLLKLSPEQMQNVRKWQHSQSKPSCGKKDRILQWSGRFESPSSRRNVTLIAPPSHSPLSFVFSSQNRPFFLSSSFFFFFHTHREPDSSSAEKLVKQIFWLYYKSVVICFPFPLTIYICLPAWLYLERGHTLKPYCTNQNKMTLHTITHTQSICC